MEKGAETGGQMVTGTVADFWKLTEDPIEYFEVRPVTTVMMVAPVLAELKGMAAAKYGPAWKAFANPKVKAAADFIDQAAQKITKSKAKPTQASKRFLESIDRLLTDPTIQATERASKFVDELMNEVKRTGDSIGTIADRYVQTLKKKNIGVVRKKETVPTVPLRIKTETLREAYPVTKKELEARVPEDIAPDVLEFETGEPLTPEQKKRAREIVQQPQQLSLPLVTEDLGKTTYVEPPQPSRLVADEKNILQIVDSLEPEIVPITEAQKKLLRDVYTKKTKLTPEVEGEFVGIKERLKRHGIDLDKRIQEGLPAAFVDDYDYLPESKSIGSSREAVQLRAEGLDLEKPGDWERFIEIRDTDPVYIQQKTVQLTDTADKFINDISLIKGVDPDTAKKQFVKNFSSISIGTLKSDIVRAEVVKKAKKILAEVYEGNQLKEAEKAFEKFVNEIINRDPESPTYNNNAVIRFGRKKKADGTYDKGTPIDLGILAYDVITDTKANQNLIDAQLLRRTAEDIAIMAKREKTQQILTKDLGTAGTINDWVVENLADIMAGREMPPAIPMNAKKIAEFLTETADTVAKKFGVDVADVLEAAEKINQYERMSPDIAEHFGISRYLVKERGGPVEVYAPNAVNSTLKFEMDAYKSVHEARGFWKAMNSAIKGNITARNLASAINNVTGNFAYQTFRRGTPLLAKDLLTMVGKYQDFRQGREGITKRTKLSDQDRAFFESMERTGYLDTDLTDAELGGIGKGRSIMEKIPLVGKLGKKIEQGLETFYKSGDTIFKLEDAHKNYNKLNRELKVLNPGEWVELDLRGKGRWSRLTRTDRGFQLDGKTLTQRELSDVLARASAQPGRKIFVDYSDVPNMVKHIRASEMLGITSPFFSWGWQVMDIPLPIVGKKGLGAYALTDSVPYRTNSKSLNAVKASAAYLRGVRRNAMLAAMREAVLAEDDETLRKILSFAPKEFNLQLLENLGSPFYIGYDSMESANQFGPSDRIIRGIMDFAPYPMGAHISEDSMESELQKIYYADIDGESKLDFMLETVDDPETKREILQRRKLLKKRLSGEGFEAGDLLSLIGMSGSPIMDTVVMMQTADRAGKTINYPKLIQTGTTAFMGGTAARTLEIGLEKFFPEQSRAITTRRWALNTIDKPSEDFIRWSIRRLTGLGFRPMDIGERSEYYWSNKAKEWKATLTKEIKASAEDPEVPLTGEERDAINERIAEIEKIVDGEIMLEKLHFQKVLDKLSKQKKR
jgi:hypothetical protein